MINEDEEHEWDYRVVARFAGEWLIFDTTDAVIRHSILTDQASTELFFQRRRKRDIYDPTPCEGIEHPVWRDWEASPDPDIQGVLIAKGMPFRSLEK